MNTWIVETKGLKKYYKLGGHIVKALDGVDFPGEGTGICRDHRQVGEREEYASAYGGRT